ncbi:DMT family transporter [Glycomyces sp. A-F 0318]|uniref:DMT family transporter n=1 Tax=Glycomyces amatae TaxID=2881355 RepID=UPI001E3AC643|nr:DMT family transporter [Glycomyces amatae]MCD0445128.1 DMT family transporter [Glycomyces amatae]
MGIALALASALSYGVSDVLGGLAARRAAFMRVALVGQIGGLGAAALLLPALPSVPLQGADLVWGAGSGVGTGLAMAFLFRGIGRGAMSVVVPLSAVGGVALPVLVSTAFLGERPPWPAWAGLLVALPALWLIGKGAEGAGPASRGAVCDGLAASGGIALQYLCLAQADAASGLWPVLSGRAAAIATILVAAAVLLRRTAARDDAPRSPSVLALSVGAGVLAAYLFALRTEFITVTVVLSSLYPVVPVIVGLLFLGERLRRSQAAGLAAAVLIAVA